MGRETRLAMVWVCWGCRREAGGMMGKKVKRRRGGGYGGARWVQANSVRGVEVGL